jgi:hypothetical protein
MEDTYVPKVPSKTQRTSVFPIGKHHQKIDNSIDSVNRVIRRAFQSTRHNFEPLVAGDKGLRISRPIQFATAIEPHPNLNFFLVGSGNNSSPQVQAHLYQFELEPKLVTYTAPSEGHLTRIRFDPYGSKFGGADSRGNLFIWKFDASLPSLKQCISLGQFHTSIADFTFLDSSSVLATVGASAHHMNVAIWDTLMPPSKSRVQSKIY